MVWDPYQLNHTSLLERIQHRFLRYMSFKLGKPMKFTENNYDHLLANLNLMTLVNRRIYLSLSFLHKLLSGTIDCPKLLECIRLQVPARPLRFNPLFHIEKHCTVWFMALINHSIACVHWPMIFRTVSTFLTLVLTLLKLLCGAIFCNLLFFTLSLLF